MNQLRDTWRIEWQHAEANTGPGHQYEGLWVMPYEASASTAARDASIWLARGFSVPGGEESYPVSREVIVYRMDHGEPLEVARTKVTKAAPGLPFLLADGTAVTHTVRPDGWTLETWKGWTETHRRW